MKGSPTGSCVQTLDPQLFRTAVEPLGSEALLEEVGHAALALRFHFLSPLPVYSLYHGCGYNVTSQPPARLPCLPYHDRLCPLELSARTKTLFP